MTGQDEREDIERLARHMFENRTRELDASPDEDNEWDILPWRDEWIEGAEVAMEGLRALGFRRPTPHVVNTVEELRALVEHDSDSLVLSSNGLPYRAAGVLSAHDPSRYLPATVLTPAPAPADREALVERVARALYGHHMPGDIEFWDGGLPENFKAMYRREARAALDAIEGVRHA